MLLKEQITYHRNHVMERKIGKKGWYTIWPLSNETIQLERKESGEPGDFFTLRKAEDSKVVFKAMTKLGYNNRSAEHQAFKRVLKSHELEWVLKDCSYTWEIIDGVLTLIVANVDYKNNSFVSGYGSSILDNKRTEVKGNLIAIRYEQSDKQSQAILYHEYIDRKININSAHPTMHHKTELMKQENRKRAIKAKSLRDVVEVTNHNAEVLNETVDDIAMLKAEHQAMMAELAALKAEHQALKEAQTIQIDL